MVFIKLQKPKNFNNVEGQFIQLLVPQISQFQWHPFSLCSSGENECIILMIKDDGNWTKLLLEMLYQLKLDVFMNQFKNQPNKNSDVNPYSQLKSQFDQDALDKFMYKSIIEKSEKELYNRIP